MSHVNARLNPPGKLLLIGRVTLDSRPVSHVAKELGIFRQCAHLALIDAAGRLIEAERQRHAAAES